jgi:hypothetical protein
VDDRDRVALQVDVATEVIPHNSGTMLRELELQVDGQRGKQVGFVASLRRDARGSYGQVSKLNAHTGSFKTSPFASRVTRAVHAEVWEVRGRPKSSGHRTMSRKGCVEITVLQIQHPAECSRVVR